MKNEFLDGISEQSLTEVKTRRDVMRGMGSASLGLALASVPAFLAAAASRAKAQVAEPTVTEILNFALTLEYLEAEFYTLGVASNITFPGNTRQVFTIIRDHEQAHVDFLLEQLGDDAVAKPEFDFTAGGAFPNVFSDYATFVTLAQGFEDTGVRAYKGAAPFLIDNDAVLTAALTIHSIEARHASKVRRLAGSPAEEGWIPFDNTDVEALRPVYAGEAEIVQLGINVVNVSGIGAEAVTEAWDEPLSMQAVLEIVDQFIVGDVDGDGQAT